MKQKKTFWLCRCDSQNYEIWTIKPKWDGDYFIHAQLEIIASGENVGSLTLRCARVLFPDAVKGLRVGCSREVTL